MVQFNEGVHGPVPPVNEGTYTQVPPVNEGGYGPVPPVNEGMYTQVPPVNPGMYGPVPPESGPPPGNRKKIALGVGAAALLAAILAAVALASGSMFSDVRAKLTGNELKSIAENCGKGTFRLVDDNKSLNLTVNGSSSADQFEFLSCLLDETGAPASVKFRMGNTRQMDGTQEADWDGWKIFWSYDGSDEEMSVLLSKV